MKKRQVFLYALFLLISCNDESANPSNEEPLEDLPKIVINEFLASNTSCCTDPDGVAEEYNDWIELYNADDKAVDIGGLFISDKKDNPKKYQIPVNAPDKTTIPPGGYLLLWADNQSEQGPLHLSFALNADGEDVGIYAPDGRAVDEYSFPLQTTDVSSGRLPNGTGSWTTFETPTPGAANQ